MSTSTSKGTTAKDRSAKRRATAKATEAKVARQVEQPHPKDERTEENGFDFCGLKITGTSEAFRKALARDGGLTETIMRVSHRNGMGVRQEFGRVVYAALLAGWWSVPADERNVRDVASYLAGWRVVVKAAKEAGDAGPFGGISTGSQLVYVSKASTILASKRGRAAGMDAVFAALGVNADGSHEHLMDADGLPVFPDGTYTALEALWNDRKAPRKDGDDAEAKRRKVAVEYLSELSPRAALALLTEALGADVVRTIAGIVADAA